MINQMQVADLKAMMDGDEEFILIDCREKDEYESGHIKGSQFMPLSNFGEEAEALKNRNAKIVLQCRSGKRSMTAAQHLLSEGFEDLHNLEGGILAWQEAGYETE